MNPLKRFAVWVSTESPVILYGLNALVTAWAAFGFRASPAQVAAVTTIGAAVCTICTAFAARPVSVPVITGAVATVATAAAAFGLHLTAAQIGAGVPVLALVLSLILRQSVTPLVTLRAQAHVPEHAAGVHVNIPRLAEEDVQRIVAAMATAVKRGPQRSTPRTM